MIKSLWAFFGFVVGAAIFVSSAEATCSPIKTYIRYVGDTASDSQCTDNDIQSAINNSSCPTTIVITGEHTYTFQALTISGKSVVLEGTSVGYCGNISEGAIKQVADSPITISGSSGNSVIHIDGSSNVTLTNLVIKDGSVSNIGGGIYFGGSGSLTLNSTLVIDNAAGSGGGIGVAPTGATNVTLGSGSVIEYNSATANGGGIAISGQTYLQVIAPSVYINGNTASNGDGGGIDVIGPAQADIASPGYFGLPVINGNSAAYGGGIAATAVNQDQDAVVRLFTTDPNNPVQISGNVASHTGGGIFLHPLHGEQDYAFSVLCANDFRIDSNVASEGSAIYADEESYLDSPSGSEVYLNIASAPEGIDFQDCQGPQTQEVLGGVACAVGVPCNEINYNVTQDSSGNPTTGAAILLQSDSELFGSRFSMIGNKGGHAIRLLGDASTYSQVDNCVMVQNQVTQELVNVSPGGGGAQLYFDSCTFADNDIGAPYMMLAQADKFSLFNSIVSQPGRATVDFSGSTLNARYILSNDVSTLGSDSTVVIGTPTFVNAAAADYHLMPKSQGVDFAPQGGTTLDRDGNPRLVDLPDIANKFGGMDLGAYEIQAGCEVTDTIFCDGFEPSP
jgi:hypothetical protein